MSEHLVADVYEVDLRGAPILGVEEDTEHRVRCVCACGFPSEGADLEEAEAGQLSHQREHDPGEARYAGCVDAQCEALRDRLAALVGEHPETIPAEAVRALLGQGGTGSGDEVRW